MATLRRLAPLALSAGVSVGCTPDQTPAITGASSDTVSFVVQSLAVGFSHACGLSLAGATFCWGRNTYGALGDGSTTTRLVPVRVAGDVQFRIVAAGSGGGHTCAIAANGSAHCWGDNVAGELGDNSMMQRATPVPVDGNLSWETIAAGGFHSCGVSVHRGIGYCWGNNTFGTLGTGDTVDAVVPRPIAGTLKFQSIAAGRWHTCGLTATGVAYCWGQNVFGQLGDGTLANASSPVKVAGTVAFTQITVGEQYSCAVTTSGAAYCWGSNGYGQLGDGTKSNQLVPVAVSGSLVFESVSALYLHTCGVVTGGDAYCWGFNAEGQLGNGSRATSTTPSLVAGNLAFADVAAGGNGTCGRTTAGVAYCWGMNSFGELGTGDVASRLSPTRVRAP